MNTLSTQNLSRFQLFSTFIFISSLCSTIRVYTFQNELNAVAEHAQLFILKLKKKNRMVGERREWESSAVNLIRASAINSHWKRVREKSKANVFQQFRFIATTQIRCMASVCRISNGVNNRRNVEWTKAKKTTRIEKKCYHFSNPKVLLFPRARARIWFEIKWVYHL